MRRWLGLSFVLALGCGAGGTANQQRVAVARVDPQLATPPPIRPVLDPRKVPFLPIAEALPTYRDWARDDDPAFATEGLTQLTWARDPEAVPLLAEALRARDHGVRATAATAIAELGSPAADVLVPGLTKALAEATPVDRVQLTWALVTLRDRGVLEAALRAYRAGDLQQVALLDGRPAFELHRLTAIVPPAKATTLTTDTEVANRHLGVVVLTRDAGTTPPPVLLSELSSSDSATHATLLDAIGEGAGGRGLVLALRGVDKTHPDREKFHTKAIFDRLKALADPAAADLLVRYLETNPHPHWKTEAALRLAEIGDLRAVPFLAWRLEQDPLTLYKQDLDPEYRRDDNERVVAARMLADLAVLYPDRRTEIRKQAYAAVRSWMTNKPQPHANGLRFMAAADAKEALPRMRKWANPSAPIPQAGQQAFPLAWATAQTALRYIGWMKDAESWPILEKQLQRRPANVDATMESLLQGGQAVLGMSLRSLGTGAAQGFAQWGDPKAYPLLVAFIEDRKNNEQARIEAGAAVAWVATDAQMTEVAQKVRSLGEANPHVQVIRSCYLEALGRRPVPAATASLVDLLTGSQDLTFRRSIARAIGSGNTTPETVQRLFEKLKDPDVRVEAAYALLVGADADTARRALASLAGVDPAVIEELKVLYDSGFGYLSDAHYDNGDIARWSANAETASHAKIEGVRQEWVRALFGRAAQGIDFDNGPRSLTRVQLRVKLLRDARGSDVTKRDAALRLLRLMNERGVLLSLQPAINPRS